MKPKTINISYSKFTNYLKKHNLLTSSIIFFLLVILMLLIMLIEKFAPFGNKSFATMDANIQYLDFFSFLKNVLEGKDSIVYSLNALLGNSNIGLFSYYLSSPLNILIIFFDKSNLNTFFDILVLLKIALSGFTFAYYLQKRFKNLNTIFIILLPICYGLMQYNIAQASNIMWLDGIYMLPLILLGIYKLIKYKKSMFLSVSVGLSIIFNWYSGGINCVFSIFWFIVEELLDKFKSKNKIDIKLIFKDILRYIFAMIVGIMLSAILFLPTIFALRQR